MASLQEQTVFKTQSNHIKPSSPNQIQEISSLLYLLSAVNESTTINNGIIGTAVRLDMGGQTRTDVALPVSAC